MPTIHGERGYRFGFYAGDGGERPHIHVAGKGGMAKLWLGPVQTTEVAGYNRQQTSEIVEIVKREQGNFLRKWHDYFR